MLPARIPSARALRARVRLSRLRLARARRALLSLARTTLTPASRTRPAFVGAALAALCALSAVPARAGGLAHSDNFIVVAADQPVAERVLHAAEDYRQEAAKYWLGRALPPSVGRAVINVEISEREDSGLTWAIDSPARKMHKVWITGRAEQVDGRVLQHECVHVVLETRFPGALPVWCTEGAASQVDDAARQTTRSEIIRWYAQTGQWPALQPLLAASVISDDDRSSYALAASLTAYLLSRGSPAQVLQFAVEGKARNWDAACQHVYGIATVGELERAWHAWAGQSPIDEVAQP